MTDNQQRIIAIKSDILSLWVNSKNDLTRFSEYIELLQECLSKYFDTSDYAFLIYERDNLVPIDYVDSLGIKLMSIPWQKVAPCFEQRELATLPSFFKEDELYSNMTDMLLFQSKDNEPMGVLLLKATEKWTSFACSSYLDELVEVLSHYLNTVRENLEVIRSGNQYRKLFNMTELFHSTMDIDLILENVLGTIQENFPDFNVELILSNDQDRQTTINIKLFNYLAERPSTIEAFVSGEINTELAQDLNRILLNAPIKGRQAIYGILQVSAPISYVFSTKQKDFIRLLAHASGNALENAKLYHQSHRLISDLQLINETSHRLNMKLDINDMLVFLQKQLIKSFQPMEISFVFKNDETYDVAEPSTNFFKQLGGQRYIQYVEKHFERSLDPLFIADYSRLTSEDVEYCSIMAIPMLVEEHITGYSIVLHKEPYFFSFDSFKLMQSLIHHSSLAIANSMLRNQLQEMVNRDHLTKLYARSYLDHYVEKALHSDDSGMFLLVDIDNFKCINDTYGHQVGDEVLVQIAMQFKMTIGSRGICARWGGEEMSIYVPNTKEDEAIKIAEEIVAIIPQTTKPSVTISGGLITWDKSNRPSFQEIFLKADTALYQAKNNGKNQFCLYDDTLQLNN